MQYGLTSAELYNPCTGTSSFTGSLNTGRYPHTATLLNNGTVWIVGGLNNNTRLSNAELYDASTGPFTLTGGEHSVRSEASVTLLNNGMVLFAGGYDGLQYLSSAEIYGTSTGVFTVVAGSLNTPRAGQSGTMESKGKVLIAGGSNSRGIPHQRGTGTFHPHWKHRHTTRVAKCDRTDQRKSCSRPEKTVSSNGGYVRSAELYNPSTGKLSS